MNHSTIERCISRNMNSPIKKIIVKEKKIKNRKDSLWVVTSRHAENINLLTRRKSLDRVDLICLTDLGFEIEYEV